MFPSTTSSCLLNPPPPPAPSCAAAAAGARPPPGGWWGRELGLLGPFGPGHHRRRVPLFSDMFAAVLAAVPHRRPAAPAAAGGGGGEGAGALVVGFLAQREHFGGVALDPWRRGLALYASADGAALPAGRRMRTDWAAVQAQGAGGGGGPAGEDRLEWYAAAAGRHGGGRVGGGGPFVGEQAAAVTGWCR
jgi:hypothetical protein